MAVKKDKAALASKKPSIIGAWEKARSDALFDSIGDGAIATDEHGRISKINKMALEILKFKESDVMGKWFPGVIAAYDKDRARIEPINRAITQAFLTGRAISDKVLYRTGEDELVPVSVTVSPVVLRGRPIGAIEVFRDISQEEEVDRMKSEFISLASHQLRTPLTAINIYVRMLDDGYQGILNDGQRAYVQKIIGSINRMNELITALLNISRIESGIVGLQTVDTDARILVQTITDEFMPIADSKNITIKREFSGTQFVLRSDPLLLREIYANLISNAIKYTPEGGKVEITMVRRDGFLLFRIKDTGYGIPQKDQDKIFTKFYRAANIMNKDTTGTGLGLYLVKQIANMLGGDIWFKSKEGNGTVFYFTHPVYKHAKQLTTDTIVKG